MANTHGPGNAGKKNYALKWQLRVELKHGNVVSITNYGYPCLNEHKGSHPNLTRKY